MKKHNYEFVLALAAIWGSSALAACAGLYLTKNPKCLLVMLIPAAINVKSGPYTKS